MAVWRSFDISESNGLKVDAVIALKFPAYLVQHERKIVWLIHQHRSAYELVDSVHVNGAGRLAFVDRQQFLGNATVDLAGAREHDLRLGRDAPARIEQSELAATVDLQVSKRILHGVDVADLTGQVEDDGLAANKALHGQHVAHVDGAHRQVRVVLDRRDVEGIAAGLG